MPDSFVPKPINGTNTTNVAVGATNTSTALGGMVGQREQSIRLVNSGTQNVFFNFSAGAGTAVLATDMPMLPGTTEVFTIPAVCTHINTIAPATGSTLYWTFGDGA